MSAVVSAAAAPAKMNAAHPANSWLTVPRACPA
jgi:hypothetical protein